MKNIKAYILKDYSIISKLASAVCLFIPTNLSPLCSLVCSFNQVLEFK